MSNENKGATTIERGGSGKNDPNRTAEATTKGGQQSQDASHQSEKGTPQQGGSDHKSGQQSQGGNKDSGGMKQGGGSGANDTKTVNEAGNKGGASK
jgi:general stress protein YciG